MLTRCNAKYASSETAKGVWYTLGDHSCEGFLLVRTEPKRDDAIDLGKISKLFSHVDQIPERFRSCYDRDISNET